MTAVALRNGTHYRYNFRYIGRDHLDEELDQFGRMEEHWTLSPSIVDWLAQHNVAYTESVDYHTHSGDPTDMDLILFLIFIRPQDAILFKLTWM